jgi:hypothetical protein
MILFSSLIGGLLIGGSTYAIAWALCRIAAKPTPKVSTIGRRSYAEGRPTMPSQAEPMDEQARRRAPIRYPHRNAYDTRLCECEYCMEPTCDTRVRLTRHLYDKETEDVSSNG